MTVTEYLRSLSDDELVKSFDDFSGHDEEGWVSCSYSVTPYGTLSKTIIEREIDRRVKTDTAPSS
jgi:hypothetical protein